MNQAQTASARHHAYILMSRLYLNGLSADLLPYVRALPELSKQVPDPWDLDEEAARHFQVLGHDILPYESIFRGTNGLLGGRVTAEVNAAYQLATVDFLAQGDHIGHEIAFLAALCAAEAAAWRNQDAHGAQSLREQQYSFLHHHLLTWLSPFIIALSATNDPFFTALGNLTIALASDHCRHLAALRGGKRMPLPAPDNASGLKELIMEEKTNLKKIAAFILIPSLSGFYLGRENITRLARGSGLPRGFGSRVQMLSNLFYAAVEYDLLDDVLRDLSTIGQSWQQAYLQQIEFYAELAAYIEPWRSLVAQTSAALEEMIALAAGAAVSP